MLIYIALSRSSVVERSLAKQCSCALRRQRPQVRILSGAPFQNRTLNTGYAGFSARGSDQSAQQFGFRSHDADFLIRDLDTLGQRAEVVAAIAAAVQPDALASRAGEGSDHVGADGLVAGMVEGSLCAFGVGAGLFPNRLEAGDTLFQAGGVEVGDAGLDGVEEPVERKRFGVTTVLALAPAVACDPIDSWWISMASGLISPAGDVGFVGEDLCEASHVR